MSVEVVPGELLATVQNDAAEGPDENTASRAIKTVGLPESANVGLLRRFAIVTPFDC